MIHLDNDQYKPGVVFMFGLIFRIESFVKNLDGIWTLQLLLIGNDEIDLLKEKQQTLRK